MSERTEYTSKTANVSETARRLFWLYQILPRDKAHSISAKQIEQKYEYSEVYQTQDNTVSKRKTLNNDLHQLHRIFAMDDEHICRKPSWDESVAGKTVQYWINPNQQLMQLSQKQHFIMVMVQHYMRDYLPVELQKEVDRFINQAQTHAFKSDSTEHHRLVAWKDKIFAFPELLEPPNIQADVLKVVYEAIFENKQIIFDYQKKWHKETEYKTLNPVGIVLHGNKMYLSGFYPAEDTVQDDKLLKEHRLFALQRMSNIVKTDNDVPDWVARFPLNTLYELGKLQPPLFFKTPYKPDEKVAVELKVSQLAMQHLMEMPLDKNQQYTKQTNSTGEVFYQVTANIRLTDQLLYWILSMNHNVIVNKPQVLRAEVVRLVEETLAGYRKNE